MYSKAAVESILKKLSKGRLSARAAFKKLRHISYETLSFARLDHNRLIRKNLPEAVYGPGKTFEQLVKITSSFLKSEQPFLITRVEESTFRKLKRQFKQLSYSKEGRLVYFKKTACHPSPAFGGVRISKREILPPQRVERILLRGQDDTTKQFVAVVTAGTSDIPAAEEARVTLDVLGISTQSFYDLGVSGLHRLIDRVREIEKAQVVICIAGMEGALASVLAGLISKPVIAVPTSVGHGANFKGLSALLTMMNSCAQGVAVVNIDSGFSAACFASLILNPYL